MQGEEANVKRILDSLKPEVRDALKAKIEADAIFNKQVDADLALVTGGRSCSKAFVEKYNAAIDRLHAAFPGADAWTWHWNGRPHGYFRKGEKANE